MSSFEKKDLSGKIVVVTGGASGIGKALCKKFAMAGASIACLDMDSERIDTTVDKLKSEGIAVRGYSVDVTDERRVTAVMESVIEDFGGIDMLFNNAGITQRSAFRSTDSAVYRKVMEVNFFGSLYCTMSTIESIIERKGSIVVTSSIAGLGPLLGRTGYSASKHALHGLFESLRTEVGHLGVHIMMLCPGFTRTNLQTRALDADGSVTTHPQSKLGREDTPEYVAEKTYQAVMKRKRILVLTKNGKIGYLIRRLFPSWYERIITNKFKGELEGR